MQFMTNKRIDAILMTGIRTGAAIKRAEIIGYLHERRSDLDMCCKSDSCAELASFIDGLIEDLDAQAKTEWDQWMDNNG